MIELIKKQFGNKGSFRRNSLIMSSGAMVNILIALVFTPIVTRIYGKEEFGIYFIFSSVVAISSVLVHGMYPHALVIPKFKRDFLTLLKLCFTLTTIGVGIFTLFIFLGGHWFLNIINGQQIGNYVYLLPVALFLTSINLIFINWNVRRKEFKKNVSSTVVRRVTGKAVQISYGSLISSTFPGLIFSDILSSFVGTVILSAKTMRTSFVLMLKIKWDEVKRIAIEYVKYPTYMLGSNFVNRTTSDIPLYLISAYFGLEAVGAFSFARSMLRIPYNVIGSSIVPVYYQRAMELYNKNPESLKSFTKKSYDKMLLLGCLAFGFIFGFGDIIFRIVFSAEWDLAGKMAMILSVYYVFMLISSPFASVFRVVRKEEITLKVNIILSSLRVIGIGVGVLSGSVLVAIASFSAANLIGYAYNNFQVFKVLNISLWIILKKTCLIMLPIFLSYYGLRLIILSLINI